MWNANRLWGTTILAAVCAFAVEFTDCIVAGCGTGGGLVLAFRLGTIGIVIAALAHLGASRLFANRSLKFQLLVAVLLVAPLAISSGFHLATTASVSRLIGYHYRVVVPTVAMTGLYTAYFLLVAKIAFATHRTPWKHGLAILLSLCSAFALFALASYFKKLHYPLALAALFFCWMNLINAFRMVLLVVPLKVTRAGVCIFLCIGVSMFFWPVSLEDTFIASDQGILARDLTTLGRAHTMDELVETAAPPDHPLQFSPPPITDLPQHPQRSIVLISVDALRPDHLGFNGYKRNVSPAIDALLKESVVFNRTYCSSPTSSFSIPSIHAGMPMEQLLKSGAEIPPLLATQLSRAGYTTIGLYPSKVFSMGPALMGRIEEAKFGFQYSEILKMDARKDIDTAQKYLNMHQSDTPLFMWVHLYDPHLPYSCHEARFGASQPDCYDAEIAFLDHQIQPFLDAIEKKLDDPIIVFTADHGEAFGEHGRFYHSTDLYDEQIRVPLAFKVPNVSPRRVDTPVSNYNLFDTLLALVTSDHSAFAANDLRPWMVATGVPKPIMSAIGEKRAIIWNDHKLMCENWPRGACALFDLKRDPSEKLNLAAKQIPQTVSLLGLLKESSEMELARLRETAPRPIILGRLQQSGASEGLRQLAMDARSPWAVEATKLIALLQSNKVEKTLNELCQSSIPEVVAWANIGNALLGNTFEPETLRPYVSENSELGHWSIIVLGRNGDTLALKPLVKLLKTDEPKLQALAALALGRLGNPRAVPALIALLEIKQSRWAAIEALGELEDRRALGVLRTLKKSEPDVSNLPRYEKAIERIESN